MVCTECGQADSSQAKSSLSFSETLNLCRTYKCAQCSRTPEQIQQDFDRASVKPAQVAHDWASLQARGIVRPTVSQGVQ